MSRKGSTSARWLLGSVLLISAAALALEILLMRVLSIVQWHHFAWMIISLALLGYGASGTAIALCRSWAQPRFRSLFSLSALLFSITMVVCFVLGQRIPFNALEVVWDPRQLLYLGVMYLVFMLPFFFAATCLGLAFTCRDRLANRIYLFDLLGAGSGALLMVAALFLLQPRQAVVVLAALVLAASVLSGGRVGRQRRLLLAQLAWAVLLVVAPHMELLELRMSEFKGQSQALETVGTRIVAERSSPLGHLAVIESPRIPFRHAPGLSFATRFTPPEQLAVFTDGDAMTAIHRWRGDPGALPYLGDLSSALPYALLDEPRVLVLGAGAGSSVLQALHLKAAAVDAVELNPQILRLVRETFRDFAGPVFDHERVEVHVGEARGFVARTDRRYDLIQLGLLDSFAASGSGVQALNENYLYTVEAIDEYLDHLERGGLLAITRWLRIPPRDSFKLLTTAVEALRGRGVADPAARIALIRGWNTVTLLVKSGELDGEDIGAIREFARKRAFDTIHYPGMAPSAANRYNRLERAWFYEGARALLSDRAETFQARYKFNIEAATDDRPYFFDFFRWRVLPEVLELRERGGAALIEWGYLVPAATLVQVAIAGAALILLPLALAPRRWPSEIGRKAPAYFFLLGVAFLFIEIVFIQKFILFLSHPLYAVAVVLSGFLMFAGLGSGVAPALAAHLGRARLPVLPAVVGGIVVLAAAYLLLLPPLFDRLIGLPDLAKIGISLGLIAPLAFFMGMPFPLGLDYLSRAAPGFIPWAWGINGFASVISAALAVLLAIEFGFTTVLVAALLLYVAAGWLLRAEFRG